MVSIKKRFMMALAVFFVVCGLDISGQDYRWYKGNTHTHTTNSDGDELPRRVVRWYRDNHYNFLVISDHDFLTDIKYLDTDRMDDFILIPGEEVSGSFKESPIHVNGINIQYRIDPQPGNSKVEVLQNNIDAVRKAGGIPQINHPGWKWAFSDIEMSQLKNVKLFELYNVNKDSNNFSAGGFPGMEGLWDKLLSKKILIYGVACDDTHDFLGDFRADKAYPGKGWIMVRAPELSIGAIVEALEKGDFYASVGIVLRDIQITKSTYRLWIEPQYDLKYTTLFIGRGGKILKQQFGLDPVFRFKGDELYVRARVVATSGDFAVTQPVFLGD